MLCAGCGSASAELELNKICNMIFYSFCAALLILHVTPNSAQSSARAKLQNSDFDRVMTVDERQCVLPITQVH